MKISKSLKTKLVLVIFVIIILTSMALSLTAYFVAKNELKSSVVSNLNSIIDNVRTEVFETNQKEFNLLTALSHTDFIQTENIPLENKCSFLRSLAVQDENYENIAFYDLKGNSYMRTGGEQNLKDEEFFKQSIAGRNYIKDPYFSDVSKSLLMIYSVPVYDTKGKVIGVIASIVKGEMMSNVVSKIEIGKSKRHPYIANMVTGLDIGDENIENVKSKQNLNTSQQNPELKSELEKALAGKRGNHVFTESKSGMKMIFSYAPVGNNCNWTVMSYAMYDDFFSGISKMLKIMFVIFAVAVVLASLICAFFITKSLKPLKVVDDSVHKISEGNADLTQRIKLQSDDEIGSVVKGFNKFTEKLQSIISDVKSSEKIL